MKTQQLKDLQSKVITTYVQTISKQQQYALEGSEHRWQASSPSLKERDPYCFGNFKQDLLRVLGYVGCIKACGPLWLGLKFNFPLIWLPVRPYKSNYILTGWKERQYWEEWIACNRFVCSWEASECSFNLTNNHK